MRKQIEYSMKSVRLVSKFLFLITRIAATGYFLSFLLSAIAFATNWNLNLIDEQRRFEIYYPFTKSPYLLGEFNQGYILMFLLLLGLYAIFFYLAGNVFKVFTYQKLFTTNGILQLKRFYLGNFIFPSLAILFISFFYHLDSPVEIFVMLHALLGVFTYFLAAIFKQGVNLQNEQDLII